MTATLHEASRRGWLHVLEQRIAQGAVNGYPPRVTLQQRDKILGAMPIHFAAEHGHLSLLTFLLQHKARTAAVTRTPVERLALQVDVDAGDASGATALHLACVRGHVEVVEQLLDEGARTDLADMQGNTALHWLATTGNEEIAELLLNNRASFDRRNRRGWTPLMTAVVCERGSIVEYLLQRGAQINAVDDDGNSPLHLACGEKHRAMIHTLLQYSPCLHLQNHAGQKARDLCRQLEIETALEDVNDDATSSEEEQAPASPRRQTVKTSHPRRRARAERSVDSMGFPIPLSASPHLAPGSGDGGDSVQAFYY